MKLQMNTGITNVLEKFITKDSCLYVWVYFTFGNDEEQEKYSIIHGQSLQ